MPEAHHESPATRVEIAFSRGIEEVDAFAADGRG
jgi:hypothetical protein